MGIDWIKSQGQRSELERLRAKIAKLEANELKIWGEEKPEHNRAIAVYLRNICFPIGALSSHTSCMALNVSDIPHDVPDDTRWCYVPEPPDWDAIGREG